VSCLDPQPDPELALRTQKQVPRNHADPDPCRSAAMSLICGYGGTVSDLVGTGTIHIVIRMTGRFADRVGPETFLLLVHNFEKIELFKLSGTYR